MFCFVIDEYFTKLNQINVCRNVYPAFEPYTQQDAQECFHCILNICSSVISLVSSENFQVMSSLYVGMKVTENFMQVCYDDIRSFAIAKISSVTDV